jgi:transposase InsO family protein
VAALRRQRQPNGRLDLAASRGSDAAASAAEIHDRDADYGGDFDERLAKLDITGVRTPRQAPRANAIAERIVRTIRSECLDHVIVLNEAHLMAILKEFAAYYNRDRPHRSLELQSPVPMTAARSGHVIARSVMGGLHHVYARAA